jgi:nitroreductase
MPLPQIIQSRRTIGVFQPDPIDPAILMAAIELATWAPNHRKTEPWRFTLIGPQTQRRIVELNTRLVTEKKGPDAAASKQKQWSAVPGWLAVTMIISADPAQAEEDYAACCCGIQNLLLALWEQGVGTKWSTGDVTRHPEFYAALGIDLAIERTVGMIWYGYPLVVPQQTRRPVTEVTRTVP